MFGIGAGGLGGPHLGHTASTLLVEKLVMHFGYLPHVSVSKRNSHPHPGYRTATFLHMSCVPSFLQMPKTSRIYDRLGVSGIFWNKGGRNSSGEVNRC